MPAYTYTASASVVCHVGAKLVLIDSQSDSLEMDYEALENAINEHTKAIIPVDLGGIPCDYDRIFAIVEKKKHLFKATSAVQEAVGRVAIVLMRLMRSGGKLAWKNGRQYSGFFKLLVPCCKKPDDRRGRSLNLEYSGD